jgi:hypothetical protein
MRLKPGPEVMVIAFAPAHDAPMQEQMEAISSSICMNAAPTSPNLTDSLSSVSVAGVIG